MHTPSFDRWLVSACTAALCWGVLETAVAGAPSQTPLLGAQPVPPNVIFTLDDSGSMLNAIMPEEYASLHSNGLVAIQFLTPQEQQSPPATVESGYGYTNHLAPTRTSAQTYYLHDAKRRSHLFNTIYYNPDVRYEPWVQVNADGSLTQMAYPAANGSGEWVVELDPVLKKGGVVQTVNLSKKGASAFTSGGVTSIDHTKVTWCAIPVSVKNGKTVVDPSTGPGIENNRCASPTDNTEKSALQSTYDPAVYYTDFKYDTTGNVIEATRISLNEAKDTDKFTRDKTTRTDCDTSGATAQCSKAQEFRNFATWFKYYRTRLLLAKAAVAKAFSNGDLKDFRFAYGALNNPVVSTGKDEGSISIDGVSSKTIRAGVRDFSAARPDFYTWLFKKIAYNGTPLRRALGDVGQYVSRDDSRSPWADDPSKSTSQTAATFAGCRKSYHILTTDGYWSEGDTYAASVTAARANVDGNNGSEIVEYAADGKTVKRSYTYTASKNPAFVDDRSDMLADVAMYYWYRDLLDKTPNNGFVSDRNPAFWQSLVNYTVGLGTSGTIDPTSLTLTETTALPWPSSKDPLTNKKKADDLIHAAYNSRGYSLSAANADAFAASLVGILNDISNQSYSTAGVGISGTTLTTDFAKYEPAYTSGIWTGDVKKFLINPETGKKIDNDTTTPEIIDPKWQASKNIPDHASRNIHVWTGSTAKAFVLDNLTDDMKTDMAKTLTPSAALINFLRGDSSNEGSGPSNYRKRSSKLGDIVNSSPQYVQSPANLRYTNLPFDAASTYNKFLKDLASREAMVFVGANDGMLHAFLDTTGEEVFAFIPRAVLPTLGKLSGRTEGQTTAPLYTHQFYVDGPLVEAQAHVDGAWASLLIGSMGAGGKGVFALDVTNTSMLKNASQAGGAIKWEINDLTSSAVGHVYSEIEVGPIRVGDGYKWVALIGNGFNSASNTAQLLVVDVADGTVLKTLDTKVGDSTTPNGLGGVRAARDLYGVIQAAYAGDEQGNVWRFNLNGGSTSNWGVAFGTKPLFSATDTDTKAKPQPITATPTVLAHPRGGSMVVVGTGKLIEATDRIDAPVKPAAGLTGKLSQVQSLYGIWDRTARTVTANTAPSITKANLVERVISPTEIKGADGQIYYNYDDSAKTAINWKTQSGWYMNLSLGVGQRVIYPLQNLRNLVFVTTMVPASTGVCGESGAYNAIINGLSGTVDFIPRFDTNVDGYIDKDDAIASWYVSPSDGRERIAVGSGNRQTEKDSPTSKNACGGGQQIIISSVDAARCVRMEDQLGVRTWRIINNPPR